MDCYNLPISISIGDKQLDIRGKGDYRVILDCFSALEDIELPQNIRIYTALIIFYEDLDSIDDIFNILGDNLDEAITKMCEFFNCGKESVGMNTPYKLIDWTEDSQLICSAINNVAQTEVRQPNLYIHWWTFMGYYTSVGDSQLSTVVGIRYKIVNQKPLEKYEKEFRRRNPEFFNWNAKSIEQKQEDELLKSIWNKS